ncbi:sensor domain-containing diguanylate cyclase [Rhodocyclaceae bacterium SMB388]
MSDPPDRSPLERSDGAHVSDAHGRSRRALVLSVMAGLGVGGGTFVAAAVAVAVGGGAWWVLLLAMTLLVGLPVTLMTHAHVNGRTCTRERGEHVLSRRLDRLDAIVAVDRPGAEMASAAMLERIDAAVRQADLLREIAEGVYGIEALFDPDSRLVWISPSVEDVTGISRADCLAADDPLTLLAYDSDLGFCRGVVKRVAEQGETESFEMRLRGAGGGICWVACRWRRVERDGRPVGLRLSAENVQTRKETEYKLLETVAELRRSQALREHYLSRSNDERKRLTALLNVIRLGILFMDRDHRVLYYNRAMLDIWGFPPDENLIGMRDVVLQNRVATLLEEPEIYFRSIQNVIADGAGQSSREIRFKDGRLVTDLSAVVEGSPGTRGIGRVWIYEDVTEQRRTAERLVELAERDPLTDLYNRRRFHEDLNRVLADAERREYSVGLLIFDLDGFKPINDEFGHQAGDEVLVRMSREVGGIIRRNETFFRLGGDEFAVLVPDADVAGLFELAKRIVEGVAALQFNFDGSPVKLTASLGIALYPGHATTAESLIAAADEAMYRSKASGRNRWTIAPKGSDESARMSHSKNQAYNRRED